MYISAVFVVVMYILQIHIVLNVGKNFVCEVLDLINEQKKRGDIMINMTLKELIEYERELCSLQQEYEGKLTKIYGETDSSSEKRRLTIVLNLIIEERQKVNRQKYKPV